MVLRLGSGSTAAFAVEALAARIAGIQEHSLGEAHEFEDDAQRLALLDVEDTLVGRNIRRLRMIERALEKIKDGTYGFSDVSGKRIPRDRLEAMPEAVNER